MADFHVGRTGAIVLLVVFALLVVEDVLIRLNRGIVPGIEFFLASVLVAVVLAYVINTALRHDPGDR